MIWAPRAPSGHRSAGLWRYARRRLLVGAAQIGAVVAVVYLLALALPGDAAIVAAGDDPDPARVEAIRHQLETQGWATSLRTGQPVLDVIAPALAPTLLLVAVTVALLLPGAVALGALSAYRSGTLLDRVITTVTVGFEAVPEFALAVVLITVFALQLDVLPATALELTPAALVLPVVVLLARSLCGLTRLVRAGTVDALGTGAVAHARRHGITGAALLFRHVLPLGIAPATQQAARTIDWMIGGIVIVETVFAIPGISSVLVGAVSARDLPILAALAVLFAVATVLLNLAADVVSFRLAPRAMP